MRKIILLVFVLASTLFSELVPLAKKNINKYRDSEFARGTYLIVLSNSDLNNSSLETFIDLKKTQGYDVTIVSFRSGNSDIEGINGSTNDDLRNYLISFYDQDPMLEYVLLIGDVNQNNDSYNIPTYEIPSYNEAENDQTDYPYTFFDIDDGQGENMLEPHFFLGRWSIGSATDLSNIINRNIHYAKLDFPYVPDPSYLNNALVVAGNYSGEGTSPQNWPVTPVWTSKWVQEELFAYGYSSVDSAFFHKWNYDWATSPDQIEESWNNGIGIVNYRGWGDARGWHKPQFRLDEIESLLNPTFSMPVVFSFVCNTGDFGNESQVFCFGEKLITAGTINAPKGAVAMVGPSDLDTDTRFNNVLCGAMWDDYLEGRQSELGPALHTGKQAVAQEFEGLQINGTDIGEFYHHVYGVLGDASLSVWLKEPNELYLDGIDESYNIDNSFLNVIVEDEFGNPLKDAVGALIYNGELIAKGLSNEYGELGIDFNGVEAGSTLNLYINSSQYYQKEYLINYNEDLNEVYNATEFGEIDEESDYGYVMEAIPHYWYEISDTGTNLNLVDDTNTTINLGFDFQYYGQTFSSLTVCSNGWASFIPCLDGNTNDGQECDALSYFYNNSITFPIGPYGLLAPFYDDLDDNGGTEPFNVYSKWIEGDQAFVIQWDNLANGHVDEYCLDNGDAPDPEACKKETFQLILYPSEYNSDGDVNEDLNIDIFDIMLVLNIILDTHNPSPAELVNSDLNGDDNIDIFDIMAILNIILEGVSGGDGEIVFQYKEVYNVDDHGVTIGIESPDKNQGVQYIFNTDHENLYELPLINELSQTYGLRFFVR